MPQESVVNKNATELDHLSYDDFELRKSRFGQETLVNQKENTLCENDVEEEGNENEDGDNEEEGPYEEQIVANQEASDEEDEEKPLERQDTESAEASDEEEEETEIDQITFINKTIAEQAKKTSTGVPVTSTVKRKEQQRSEIIALTNLAKDNREESKNDIVL